MPLGFEVRLGNGLLGAGDAIVGERTGFNTQTNLGTGSWTWSGTNTSGVTVTNQVVNGSYFLATDGSVYFVPNGANTVGTISSASATTAPAFDDRTFGTTGNNTIQGDGTHEVIYGGTGTGTTNTGADTINAGAGNDQIFSGDGNDVVTGGGHSDTIQAGAGDDIVYGDNQTAPTTGTETLNWIAQGNGTNVQGGFTQDTGGMRVTVDFEATGADTAAATVNTTQFVGTQGFATNSGLQLTGNTGTSTTTTIVFDPEAGSGLSNEVSGVQFRINDVDTGNWIDRVVIRAWNAQGQPVSVTLTASGNDSVNSATGTIIAGPGQDDPNQIGGSVLVDIAGPVHHIEIVYTNGGTTNQWVWLTNLTYTTLAPTDGNDVIDGGGGNDRIFGGGGNDSITGGADQDTIYGGEGNDTLNGGSGNDTIFGDGGNDTLNGEDGNDTLFGGEGNDTMTGGAGSDTLDGGNGNDVMSDVSGANTFYGGAGSDTISGGTDADTVFGGADADSINGNDGADVLNGDAGNDRIAGGNGADTITGGADNDTLSGDAGADTLAGETGDDTIFGGAGDDLIQVGDSYGTDLIEGGEASETIGDTLDASALTTDSVLDLTALDPANPEDGTLTSGGNVATFIEIERVILGAGDDTILGSDGADSVAGGAGADRFDGGAGNDRFDLGVDSDTDVVVLDDGGGQDTVLNFTAPTPNGDGTYTGRDLLDVSDLLDAQGDPVNIWDATVSDDGFGNAVITFPGGESVTLIGVPPSAVSDPQALIAIGIPPSDGTVTGTAGDDVIDVSFAADPDGDRVDATDNILAGRGPNDDVIHAGGGDDTVFAGAGNDDVSGDAGNDTLYGGAGNDTFDGGANNDTLFGGTGADTLTGGDGNDLLVMSQGDTAYGGDGDDTFVLEDLLEAGTGPITVVGGNTGQTTGDTLQLGDLAQWSTLDVTSGPNGLSGTVLLDDGSLLTFSEIENIICFTPWTRIATPLGARPVETLVVGDMVVTRDHGLQPIRWIGRRTVPAQGAFAPVRIRPGVVTGLERDLVVSPQHRMLFQGYRAELLFGESEVLVAATHLVDGRDVVREEGDSVTYIHILFDAHEIIFAEGAATESFHPGEIGLSAVTDAARAELLALFPDLATLPGSYGRAARRSLKRHEALLIWR